jgi:hypothetical protein
MPETVLHNTAVQPLAATVGGKMESVESVGSGALEAIAGKEKGDVLAILQERPSRLLRQKA